VFAALVLVLVLAVVEAFIGVVAEVGKLVEEIFARLLKDASVPG
jgi:hypothetical protein